jgi:transcriptional repressor NF-X1
VCNKQLPCGHPCTDPCHRGACPPCINIVTHELSCACGHVVIEPPQPCGTQPPECALLCRRSAYTCGHDPLPHNCHYGPCPPCVQSVSRVCAGGHATLKAIRCSSGPVSCGNVCEKALPCGHGCPLKCHDGPCLDPERPKKCNQACAKPLPVCGHPCKAKCHADRQDAPCPPCTNDVELPCECGISKIKMPCQEFQAKLASAEPGKGVVGACTTSCAYERRLAALNPAGAGGDDGAANDRFGGLAPSAHHLRGERMMLYSFNLWEIGTKNGVASILNAEKHLGEFVRSQEKTKMLPTMQLEKRAVIHELSKYYQVQTASVDREPNRTVQLTRHHYSRIPPRLMSECLSDQSVNPETVCRNVMAHRAAATKCVIVFEGNPEILNEGFAFSFLKMSAGLFVIVDKPLLPRIFPDGKVPTPRQGHRGEETVPMLAVFAKGNDAATAFATVRKNGCPVTFHWYGEAPPPTNFANHELGMKGPAPAQARWFCDEASSTVATGEGGRGGAAPAGAANVPRPGSASWAAVARKDTARQKEQAKPAVTETSNRFGALSRQ